MKGLLYKDFLLMKGKLIMIALAAVLIVILALRFAMFIPPSGYSCFA